MRVFLNETLCPEFLGVNAVYHGFCYMPFQTERGMGEADAARELDWVAEIGLRLALGSETPWSIPGYTTDIFLKCGAGYGQVISRFLQGKRMYDFHAPKENIVQGKQVNEEQ